MINLKLVLLILLMLCPVLAVADDSLDALRKTADQGDADAQYNLGTMYNSGKGVTKDSIEANKWFRKAAQHGNAKAQYIVGNWYLSGMDAKIQIV